MAYGETRKRVEFMIGTKAFSTLEEAKRYAKEWANDEGRPIHISKETTVYRQLGTLFPKTSMSRREYVVKPSKRSRKNPRNGRSYVVRGEIPKRYWEPSQGDVVYIEGTKTRLGKPYADPGTGKTMFPLRPRVRGTTDMSAGNIKAIARVEAQANPRVRFRVGDRVTIPWEGGLQQATVKQIKVGGRMVVEFPVSGNLHNVPTKWATKVSGRRNPTRTAGPSAIPAKWTPAKVNRVGGQIQIRMGGR